MLHKEFVSDLLTGTTPTKVTSSVKEWPFLDVYKQKVNQDVTPLLSVTIFHYMHIHITHMHASIAISESTQPPLSTQSTITTEELVNQLSTGLSATEPMESAQTFAIIVNDYQSLAIGLPLALLTIFVVVIIVSVGAGLCFILRKRHTKEKVHYHHNRSILTSTSSTVELLEERYSMIV